MKTHCLNCKKIKLDVKAQIIFKINDDKDKLVSLGATSKYSSAKLDKAITSFFSPTNPSKGNKYELAMALLRVCIAGQVPFCVLDGFYFQEFV
jgi:hypothetical protein